MRVKGTFILLLAVFLIIGACSSNKPSRHGLTEAFYPDWYDEQGDAEYVFTYGQAEKVSQENAENAAYSNAMQEAAHYVESHVQSLIKNFTEEAGVVDPQVLALTSSAVRVIANAKFNGTQTSKRQTFHTPNDRYKTFVRVSIPKNQINRNMMNYIKNEEALYNAFKASQAFQELDHLLERE